MLIFAAPLNEKTSARYLATLSDETGAPVAGSTLQTATLSLFESNGHAVVNGWQAKNILNTNGWTFYETLQSVVIDGQTVTYNVAWQMTPADATIINDALKTEPHIAEVQLTWGSGKGLTHQFRLNVANLVTIT